MSAFSFATRQLLARLAPRDPLLPLLGDLAARAYEARRTALPLERIAGRSLRALRPLLRENPAPTDPATPLPPAEVLADCLHESPLCVVADNREAGLTADRPLVLFHDRLYLRRGFLVETGLVRCIGARAENLSVLPLDPDGSDAAFRRLVPALLRDTARPPHFVAPNAQMALRLLRPFPEAVRQGITCTPLNDVLGHRPRERAPRPAQANPFTGGPVVLCLAPSLSAENLLTFLRIHDAELPVLLVETPETRTDSTLAALLDALLARLPHAPAPPTAPADGASASDPLTAFRAAISRGDLEALLAFSTAPADAPATVRLFADSLDLPPRLPADDGILLTPFQFGTWGADALAQTRPETQPCPVLLNHDHTGLNLLRDDLGWQFPGEPPAVRLVHPADGTVHTLRISDVTPARSLPFARAVGNLTGIPAEDGTPQPAPTVHILLPPARLAGYVTRRGLLRAAMFARTKVVLHASKEALTHILRTEEPLPFDLTP